MLIKNKKIIIVVILLLLIGVGFVFWFRYAVLQKAEDQEEAQKHSIEQEKNILEEQILSTQKRLEEISSLSAEEQKKREQARETLVAKNVFRDVAVEGVEMELGKDKKILINRAQGYRMELPLNLIVARSIANDRLEIHDRGLMCKDDPSCPPVISIEVGDINPRKLDLEEWMEEEEKEAGEPLYSPREKLVFPGGIAYRVKESVPGRFEGFYYYWSKSVKVYSLRIADFDDKQYRSYVETFRFE